MLNYIDATLIKYISKIKDFKISKFKNTGYKCFWIIIIIVLTQNPAFSNSRIDYDWFWVFYENEKINEYNNFIIRPFYLKNKKKNETYTASLIPILYWKYEYEKKSEWKSLLGLSGAVDYTHSNGVNDYDLGLFPFFLYGSSKDPGDQYLHLWPFGGTIKGKLGQNKITNYTFPGLLLFYFFPPVISLSLSTASMASSLTTLAILAASIFMPAYTQYESRDYKAWGILWPLIQRGKSLTRDDKRFMPFYAHNYKKNTYDSYSILMIFNYQKVFMKNDEERTFFAFPFYGRRWNLSSRRNSSALFWPFFSWGYDMKRGDFEINFPWPLVQIQSCKDPYINKNIFFPFYGSYEYENNKMSFIGPFLYTNLKKHTKSYDSDYTIALVILFWYFKRDYKGKPSEEYGNAWRFFKIWPLFQCEYDDRGNLSFNLLSLFPFRDPEGYEKLYQPFWTLFEYRRLQSGEKRVGLFMRLYFQRWGEDFLNIKIPIVFSYNMAKSTKNKLSFLDYCSVFCYNNDARGKYISLLFSMFSYNNDNDGKYIRLFWIPINIGKEPSAELAKKEKKNNPNTEIIEIDDESEEILYSYKKRDSNINNFDLFYPANNVVLYTKRIF